MTPGNSKYHIYGNSGEQYVLSSHLANIDLIASFMHEVLHGKDLCYSNQRNKNSKQNTALSPLGRHLSALNQYTDAYTPKYTFHPAISYFFEEYRKHEIRQYHQYKAHEIANDGRLMSDIFDDFVTGMRKRAIDIKLKKRIADWESKTKKNKAAMTRLEETLFSRYARIAVIRLDLSHRKATFSPEDIYRFMQEECMDSIKAQQAYWNGADLTHHAPLEGRVSFEELQRDREHLFANMKGKPSLFKHLIGYIWRIECSPQAGYHLHTALFFNGSQVEHHEWLAQQIGEYWEHEITQGRGRFHNCNKEWKRTSPNYGLGIVNHYDSEKRSILRQKVLGYLCKAEQRVQVMPYPGCNLFGSRVAHRATSKGRGRPRIKGATGARQQPEPVPM